MVSYPSLGGSAAYGHVMGESELALLEDRGGVMLVFDETHAPALAHALSPGSARRRVDGLSTRCFS
ncbi:MAG: hypothetical protein ACI8T1_000730 [Verrucomicrobiales bacterium]|jgi:hypothetical protein